MLESRVAGRCVMWRAEAREPFSQNAGLLKSLSPQYRRNNAATPHPRLSSQGLFAAPRVLFIDPCPPPTLCDWASVALWKAPPRFGDLYMDNIYIYMYIYIYIFMYTHMYCNVSPRVSVYGRVQSSQVSTSSVGSRATPPKCSFQRSCGTAGLFEQFLRAFLW